MNVGKVIVRTADFRLAYRLLAGLKARKVRCAHLEHGADLPPSTSVWLATHDEIEAAADPVGIGATPESVESGIDRPRGYVAQGGYDRNLTFATAPATAPA